MQRRTLYFLLMIGVLLGGCDYFRSVPARIERAEHLMVKSQYRAAAIELKGVIDKEPNNPQARLLLARILVQLFDPLAAQRELDFARTHGASGPATNEIEVSILLTLGRYEEALTKLADAAFALPESYRSLQTGRANLGLQRFAAALESFDAVLAQTTANDTNNGAAVLDARVGRIEARAALGHVEESLTEAQAVVQSDASAAQAWILLGVLQARSGQLAPAIESFDNAHRHAEHLTVKQHADALAMVIELHLGNRNVVAAEQALRNLDKILPGTLVARLLQARIAIAKQDYPGAAAELQRIVRAAPDLAPAQFLLGMVLLQQGNINQAETHLARVVTLAPQHLEARKLLAQAQLRLDRPQAAIQSLQPALDSPGVDLQVHGLLGLAEKQAGLSSSSIEYLVQSVAEQPGNGSRRLELATAYSRAAKYEEAIAQLRVIDDPTLQAERAAMLAMAVARTQGVGSARAELEAQLARNPKDVALMSVIADFYAQTGQVQRGLQLLANAALLAPQDVGVLVARARLLVASGDVVSAERELKTALALKANDRGVLLALADVSNRRGNVTGALQWLEQLGRAEPGNEQIELLKARILLSVKQPASTQQATDILSRLVQTHAMRSDIRTAVARLYVSAGRYEEALAQLRAAGALAKQDPAIQLEIARTQVALSQFDDARITVVEFLQRQPNWLPAVALAAWLDVERHANDEAVARMAALATLYPNDAEVSAAQGEILMAVRRPALAAEAFEAALRKQPTAQVAIKAYLARSAAHLPDVAGPLERYLAVRPHDLGARGALAQAYQEQGDLKRAAVQYEKMQMEATSAVLLNNLAWVYSELNDPRALSTARAAFAIAPKNPAVADTLGWVLVKQKNYADALSVLKTAVAEAPGEPEIRYHYAVALTRLGSVAEARRALNEALRQTASFPSRAAAEQLQTELSDAAAKVEANR